MKIIQRSANPSGAYPPIQTGSWEKPPQGTALWPEGLERETFQRYNGFVILTIQQADGTDTVTACAPNIEAWEEWRASLPEEPEPEEEVTTAEMAAAIQEGVSEV